MVLHVFGSGSAAHDGDSCDRGQRGRPSALVQGHAMVLDEAMGTGGGGACAVVRRGSWEHGTIGGELKWVGVRGWGGFCSIPLRGFRSIWCANLGREAGEGAG